MARALYIHWPFCLAKCPYCDFNSHVRDSVDHAAWQSALLADMRHEHELAGGEPLDSIFFGGGTPSLMPPALVEVLLREAEQLWGFAEGIEITLEGNPSSVEAANYAALASAGINRVSLGLQSLDDQALRFLGRLHNADEGLRALDVAQQRFERVSFDLIYALPGQTAEAWEQQLRRALSFGTGHLSLYQLTIEPGTRFATMVRQNDFTPLDDDAAADLFDLTRQMTAAAGLPAYEISNPARPGEESRHNLTYWRYQDYCGIGPGAHGRLTLGGRRWATVAPRAPGAWLAAVERGAAGEDPREEISREEQATEYLLMSMRLAEGLDIARHAALAGEPIPQARIEALEALGLVRVESGRLIASDAGRAVLNAVLRDLAG